MSIQDSLNLHGMKIQRIKIAKYDCAEDEVSISQPVETIIVYEGGFDAPDTSGS